MSEGRDNIISAVAKAIGGFEKLAKSDLNKFDKYNFTSIDSFLAATGPVCSENGLVITQDEINCEQVERNQKQWLMFKFEFNILHMSDEQLGPYYRSVSVPFNGAQAFGSAQSYALKQFLRSLFQIPTGDKDDPDHQPGEQITTPSQISEKQLAFLLTFAESHNVFDDSSHLRSWITELIAPPEKLSKEQAGQMIKFLSDEKNADVSNWPSNSQKAYSKVSGKQDAF